jgi:16S rRNA processing protein RimM
MAPNHLLVMGRISGLFGVQGWVKVYSETEPKEAILTYSPWFLGASLDRREVLEGRRHGKALVARLADCDNRDEAASLVGLAITVGRDQLPVSGEDEFYWADLEGLIVINLDGVSLGTVDYLFTTPGNDVMVVKGDRERLIPFLWEDVVKEVDLDAGLMRVEWEPDF